MDEAARVTRSRGEAVRWLLAREQPDLAVAVFELPDGGYALREMEQQMVRQALEKTEGNQSRAAELLDISRDSLRYKMRKFGMF